MKERNRDAQKQENASSSQRDNIVPKIYRFLKNNHTFRSFPTRVLDRTRMLEKELKKVEGPLVEGHKQKEKK